MRTLHVAAMPFPSVQGTQALVGRMLEALATAGRAVELLVYPHGGFAHTQDFPLTRSHALVRPRSLRSGPSVEKLALDAGLAVALKRRERAFRPDVVIAHHVEAALCALCVCRAPVVYFAHTSLEHELPTYLHGALANPSARAGRIFERILCQRADRVLAVSPALARMLAAHTSRPVLNPSLPWRLEPAITDEERAAARARLGLDAATLTLGYAGNLDAYQGLDTLVAGLASAQRAGLQFTWLVATESAFEAFAARLARVGLTERTRFLQLASEPERRLLHAASDLVLVPRRSPGGLPIKLLDALGRGVPALAAERALAGLPDQLCRTFASDDPEAFRAALCAEARLSRTERLARAQRSREHVQREHTDEAFVAAFDRALSDLAGRPHGFSG